LELADATVGQELVSCQETRDGSGAASALKYRSNQVVILSECSGALAKESEAKNPAVRNIGQEASSCPTQARWQGQAPAQREGAQAIELPPQTEREAVASELSMTGVSVRRHPLYFAREKLRKLGVISRKRLDSLPDGKRVRVAGIVISRQRPPIKSGRTVIFITMEDETGLLDVTVFERVYEKWGKVIFSNSALVVDGTLQKKGRYGTVIIGERFQGFRP